jgi:hypothetical protein
MTKLDKVFLKKMDGKQIHPVERFWILPSWAKKNQPRDAHAADNFDR